MKSAGHDTDRILKSGNKRVKVGKKVMIRDGGKGMGRTSSSPPSESHESEDVSGSPTSTESFREAISAKLLVEVSRKKPLVGSCEWK